MCAVWSSAVGCSRPMLTPPHACIACCRRPGDGPHSALPSPPGSPLYIGARAACVRRHVAKCACLHVDGRGEVDASVLTSPCCHPSFQRTSSVSSVIGARHAPACFHRFRILVESNCLTLFLVILVPNLRHVSARAYPLHTPVCNESTGE